MKRAHFQAPRTLACMLVLVLAAQCLLGCESRWVETRDVGALRLTEYWSRNLWRWEGGNTHVRRTTLCVGDTRRCFEDRLLYIDPDLEFLAITPRWIRVVGLEDETPPRFLDTATGAELPCIGCGDIPGPELPPNLGQIHWSLSRDHAVCSYTDLELQRPVFGWLGFSPSGVTLRRIDPLNKDRDKVIGAYISADGSTVAWYTCGETCILHAVEVDTLELRQ